MKLIFSLMSALGMSLLIVMSANAGTVTTTTTTTVTTVKKINCYQKHKVHKKKHRCHARRCSANRCYSNEMDRFEYACPGGAYDCYYDLHGRYFKQDYLPISYGHDVRYSCLASEDPSSCS